MKRLHPNQCHAALAIGLVMATGLCGCRSPQMAATNPFLAPDRVPPPATRVIAPGTAQPYYPGDPLPTSESTPAAAAGAPIATAQTEADPANVPVAAASPALAFSNERSVAIPSDNQGLRFALPPPPATEPVAPQIAAVQSSSSPPSPVTPATYNQPVAYPAAPVASPDAAPSGPWREPQIPQSGTSVIPAQYVQPQTTQPAAPVAEQPQPAPTAPAMPVELRAVPSPGVAPVEPALMPPPRMRFPSLTSPSTWFSPAPAPAANQQLIGYMVPGANGTSQFVPVEQMQSVAAATTAGGPQQPSASVANSDGFRPR